jgi:hypothetical protein
MLLEKTNNNYEIFQYYLARCIFQDFENNGRLVLSYDERFKHTSGK